MDNIRNCFRSIGKNQLGRLGASSPFGQVSLVHFDAHLDTWDTYFDTPLTHGTVFRRAYEEGLLAADHCTHWHSGPMCD